MGEETVMWTAPRRTGNADLLAGHIAGVLHARSDHNYAIDATQPLSNPLRIFNVETGNSFLVTVEQDGGIE